MQRARLWHTLRAASQAAIGPRAAELLVPRAQRSQGALESQPQQARAVSCGTTKAAVFHTWHEPKRQRRGCEVLRWYRAIAARAWEANAHAATCIGTPCKCIRMHVCMRMHM